MQTDYCETPAWQVIIGNTMTPDLLQRIYIHIYSYFIYLIFYYNCNWVNRYIFVCCKYLHPKYNNVLSIRYCYITMQSILTLELLACVCIYINLCNIFTISKKLTSHQKHSRLTTIGSFKQRTTKIPTTNLLLMSTIMKNKSKSIVNFNIHARM